ncbi:GAF and ANTAR domain-containing protein [Streptomyces sp. NPDC057302]|uniref:GAF and ANTAR domain-containing protein n=1 Tax=Streptomyces sp. NPDC057302 TaxID=3346094 RepID=UPI00362E8DB3
MNWREFAVQMAGMARGLLAQESVASTLDMITSSAVQLVEGCDAAGILVLRKGQMSTLSPTDQFVEDCDRLHENLKEGPCFDAARRGEPVFRIHDMSAASIRWRTYAPKAHVLGVGSMMGFLLYTEDEKDLGALNLYSRAPGAFTEVSETAGWMLAAHAAVALSAARDHATMQLAMDTRETIGQAMGILMARHNLDEQGAFDVLRRYSQDRNVKLREVARQLCERGAL